MEQLPLKQLHESPFNPRRTQGPLGPLVGSIKKHGILQPLIARPVDGKLELVIGHRRFRAAKEAGLQKVPVEVRKLDEKQARELQLIENLQREDLHPMEEAEGYEGLRALGHSVESIAAEVSKSETWVRNQLTLLDLHEEGRKAFYRGDLNTNTALLIARLKKKGERVQEAGLKHITVKNRWGDVMPSREAAAALKKLLEEGDAPRARAATQLAGAKLVKVMRERTRDYALKQIVKLVEQKAALEPADLRLALTGRISEGVPAAVLARRGVETPKQLEAKVAKAGPAELRGLLVELSLTAWLDDEEDVTSARLKATCKAYGLEHREIETTVRELLAKEEQVGRAEALFAKTR